MSNNGAEEQSSSMAASANMLGLTPEMFRQTLVAYGLCAIWIGLSSGVILFNKWILAYMPFPYPVALTLMHQVFCALAAVIMVKGMKMTEPPALTVETYFRTIVPIGGTFAGTLWLGNAAYMYLSVSFIQMLKASMPVAVFLVGSTMGTEKYSHSRMGNMTVITIGIAIASYGELNFVLFGVMLQMASILTESTRLSLVQILLQSRGLKLNPLTTLYYVAPCCSLFLAVPFAFIELPKMLSDEDLKLDFFTFFANCCVALGLNLCVFLLIGKTSALTMNVAGVVKDWLLIGLSVVLFGSPVTSVNLFGYSIAFFGVCYYQYIKLRAGQKAAEEKAAEQKDTAQGSQKI